VLNYARQYCPVLDCRRRRGGGSKSSTHALELRAATAGGARVCNWMHRVPLPCSASSQESLTNVLRHADASRIDVLCRVERRYLILRVSDNGRGMAPERLSQARTFGLIGMRERALARGGDLRVAPRRSGGTVVTLTIPAVVREPIEGRLYGAAQS
jgi:hypothetical protein